MPEERRCRCAKCGAEYVRQTDKKLDFYPFCSQRCQLLDLGSWLKGDYVISRPATEEEMAEAAEEAALQENPDGDGEE